MSVTEQTKFTIEELCRQMSQGKLLAAKCKKCGKTHFPPRPICDICLSNDFEWVELPSTGKLLTYTMIHIAPALFQSQAPYAVGIAQFSQGLKIPGMIKNLEQGKIEIGMPLSMKFETCSFAPSQWPQWPRYYFCPS